MHKERYGKRLFGITAPEFPEDGDKSGWPGGLPSTYEKNTWNDSVMLEKSSGPLIRQKTLKKLSNS